MIDYAESRLKDTNSETREFLEDLIDKIKDDLNFTLDLKFIVSYLEDFEHEDFIEYTCGICMNRTDFCDCSKTGRR